MKKKILIIAVVLFVAISIVIVLINVLFATNTDKIQDYKNDNSSKIIYVSIAPLYYFVNEILQDFHSSAQVNIVVPSGVEPETYNPTPKQLQNISNSDVFFTIGMPYEEKVIDTIEDRYDYQHVIELGSHIERIYEDEKGIDEDENIHSHEDGDPHVWMSYKNAYIIAEDVYNSLIAIFPQDRETLTTNYEFLVSNIEKSEAKARENLHKFFGYTFVMYHPVLGYLALEMGLVQESIQIRGRERSLKQIKMLKNIIHDKNLSFIFIQEGFPDRSARSIAAGLGLQLRAVDPLKRDWLENINSIVDIIAKEFSEHIQVVK